MLQYVIMIILWRGCRGVHSPAPPYVHGWRGRERERDRERLKREEMRKLCKLGHKADNGLLKTARLMSANRSLALTHPLAKINLLHEHMLKLSE